MTDQSDLLGRIESGLTTLHDAQVVARLVARCLRYERALREIAIRGNKDVARCALRALSERLDDPAVDAA